ncbi:NLP/P60 family protein [Lachnospiraceae bacterium KM106-2]|nr:NLP/P60 family protein [Lachnospiraceae bacterium KM106-2]
MNRARTIIKSTLCVAAASTVLMCAQAPKASATEVLSETSIAGISLSMDKYYTAVIDNNAQEASVDLANDAKAKEAEATKTEEKKTTEKKKESTYKNTGISIAPSYVNIRSKSSEDSKILGKLYKGASAKITKTKGEWVKVKSGSVTGYIKKEYLAVGEEAEKIASQYGTKFAKINVTTVRVREKKSTDSTTLTLVPEGEKFEVLKETDKWVKIGVDEDIKGYVSKECVSTSMKFDKAISIEEEKAKEEAKKAAEEQAAQQAAQEAAQAQQSSQTQNRTQSSNSNSNSSSSSSSSSSVSHSSSSSNSGSSSSSATTGSSSYNSGSSSASAAVGSASGSGSKVASFALNYVGNPYVYGHTSLTNGTDCSGFTQSVYRHFGYSIPRTASAQAAGAGRKVSLSALQAGDLIFYSKGGSINHVAIYIGGGKVVHASTPKTGIIVSGMNYRTPYMAKRIMN